MGRKACRMTDQQKSNDNPQPENLEALKAMLEQAKQDMSAISAFAGGLGQQEEKIGQQVASLREAIRLCEETISGFTSIKGKADKDAGTATDALSVLSSQIADLTKKYGELHNIVTDINNIKGLATSANDSVQGNIQAIAESKGKFEELNSQTQALATELQKQQEGVKGLLSEVRTDRDAVIAFKQDLLDDKQDAEGNKIHSIKTQIAASQEASTTKLKEINQYHTDTQTRFDTLQEELTRKINGLLPQAGAAGLASAYFDSKARYGMVPHKTELSAWYTIAPAWAWHHLSSTLRHSVSYVFFISPLFGIAWLLLGMPLDHAALQGGLQNVKDLTPEQLPARMLLSTPFALISWFGFSSIQLNRRLYEEYNYKQRVMETYHSFEKEIDATNNPELKESLLKIMLSVVNFKPSLTMRDHQKDPGSKLLEVLNFFKKKPIVEE